MNGPTRGSQRRQRVGVASRLGRQLDYRIQLRNTDHVAMHIEAGIGISIVTDGLAKTLRGDLALVPLPEVWAT